MLLIIRVSRLFFSLLPLNLLDVSHLSFHPFSLTSVHSVPQSTLFLLPLYLASVPLDVNSSPLTSVPLNVNLSSLSLNLTSVHSELSPLFSSSPSISHQCLRAVKHQYCKGFCQDFGLIFLTGYQHLINAPFSDALLEFGIDINSFGPLNVATQFVGG